MCVKISNKIKWTKIDLGCRHVTAVLPMSWNSLVWQKHPEISSSKWCLKFMLPAFEKENWI